MPDLTPREDREISTAETTWLREFFSYEASALIKDDPDAQAAAKNLIGALGGSPPPENVTGWLDSETDAIEGAALAVVEDAEQTVLESPELAETESESDELDDVDGLDDDELDEEVAYFAQLGETELDELIALYDKLLELVDRVGDEGDLSDADMETLAAAAEAGVITLKFEDDEVEFEVVDEGGLILESSVVEQ